MTAENPMDMKKKHDMYLSGKINATPEEVMEMVMYNIKNPLSGGTELEYFTKDDEK
jgi:hypothetical protein